MSKSAIDFGRKILIICGGRNDQLIWMAEGVSSRLVPASVQFTFAYFPFQWIYFSLSLSLFSSDNIVLKFLLKETQQLAEWKLERETNCNLWLYTTKLDTLFHHLHLHHPLLARVNGVNGMVGARAVSHIEEDNNNNNNKSHQWRES